MGNPPIQPNKITIVKKAQFDIANRGRYIED